MEAVPAGRQARLVEFVEKVNRREIQISAKDDMYAPLVKRLGGQPTSSRTRNRSKRR